MKWEDEGFIIGKRPHGETSLIMFLLTRHHGRHAGYVRGGRRVPKKGGGMAFEAGNLFIAHWRARADEQMGQYRLEAKSAYAFRFLDNPKALAALHAACACAQFLPERAPCERVFSHFAALVEQPSEWLMRFAHYEFMLLAELGYGLDGNPLPAIKHEREAVQLLAKTGVMLNRHIAPLPRARRTLAELLG